MNTNAFAGGVFSPTSSSISLPEEITVPGNYANGSTLWKSTATVFNLKAVLNTAFEYDVSKAVVFANVQSRSEEHTSELQSQSNLVCRLLLEKKKKKKRQQQPE